MKIFIIGGGMAYRTLFNNLGFEVVDDIYTAESLCFTGGADVNPELYGEGFHPRTHMNPQRDVEEIALYKFALNRRMPMLGICRGGQFLHVMNGGKLYQHVNGHAIGGTHKATDVQTGAEVYVTSTHHQMMRQGLTGELVCHANISGNKEFVPDEDVKSHLDSPDVEVMWYEDNKCLCFQPHPELVGADSTYLYFKNLLERYNVNS